MRSILFVCFGNICRSPMAEVLMNRALAESDDDNEVSAWSAGVWAANGRPPSANAVQVMSERGLDISHHRAHNLTGYDVETTDLILTMTREFAIGIKQEWPRHAHKVYLLSEMAGENHDIEDPYTAPLDEYRVCADELERLIEKGYDRILSSLEARPRKLR